jgi:hypothetical protein
MSTFASKLNEGKILINELKTQYSPITSDPTDICKRFEHFKNVYEILEKEYNSAKIIYDELKINIHKYLQDYKTLLDLIIVSKNTEENYILLNNHVQNKTQYIVNSNVKNIEISPGVNISAIQVKNVALIPETPIYYIEDTKEFGINIGGTIIRGNIIDISPPRIKPVVGQIPASSFLYIPGGKGNVRHIGNKKELFKEIIQSTPYEKNIRKLQTMNDILTCLSIDNV